MAYDPTTTARAAVSAKSSASRGPGLAPGMALAQEPIWSTIRSRLMAAASREARLRLRALAGAAAIGGFIGLAMAGAWLGGSAARSLSEGSQVRRLSDAARLGFSDAAYVRLSGGDPAALAVAARHDPYAVAGGPARDRAATLYAAGLDAAAPSRASALFVRAGLRAARLDVNPAARPFRAAGALDASRDLDCLSQAVYYEARGEGLAGMRAVAQVVLNRVRHPAFPKSVCGVVYQGAGQRVGCQFSFTCDGSMRRPRQDDAWARARAVAAKALSGFVMAEVGSATHFHTTGVSPGWRASLLRVAQVGSHIFYRFSGAAGQPPAFRFEPRPSDGMDQPRAVLAGYPAPAVLTEAVAVPYKILFRSGEGEGDVAADEADDGPTVTLDAPTPQAPIDPAHAAPHGPATSPAPAADPAAATLSAAPTAAPTAVLSAAR